MGCRPVGRERQDAGRTARSCFVWPRHLQRVTYLLAYDATTHSFEESTIFTLTDKRATGEANGLAHHVTVEGNERRLMIASLRYLDTFTNVDGSWLFAERHHYYRE